MDNTTSSQHNLTNSALDATQTNPASNAEPTTMANANSTSEDIKGKICKLMNLSSIPSSPLATKVLAITSHIDSIVLTMKLPEAKGKGKSGPTQTVEKSIDNIRIISTGDVLGQNFNQFCGYIATIDCIKLINGIPKYYCIPFTDKTSNNLLQSMASFLENPLDKDGNLRKVPPQCRPATDMATELINVQVVQPLEGGLITYEQINAKQLIAADFKKWLTEKATDVAKVAGNAALKNGKTGDEAKLIWDNAFESEKARLSALPLIPYEICPKGYERIYTFRVKSVTNVKSIHGMNRWGYSHEVVMRQPILLRLDDCWESHEKRIMEFVNSQVQAMWQSDIIHIHWKEDAQATGKNEADEGAADAPRKDGVKQARVFVGAITEITGNHNGKITLYPQYLKGRDMGCGITNKPMVTNDGFLVAVDAFGRLWKVKGDDIQPIVGPDGKILTEYELSSEFILSAQEWLRRGGTTEGGKNDGFNTIKTDDIRKILEECCFDETGMEWVSFNKKMQTFCDTIFGPGYDWRSKMASLGSSGNHFIELNGLMKYNIQKSARGQEWEETKARLQKELDDLIAVNQETPSEELHHSILAKYAELAEMLHPKIELDPELVATPKIDELITLMITIHSGGRKFASDVYDALLALAGGIGGASAMMFYPEHIDLALEAYDLCYLFALLNRSLCATLVVAHISQKFGLSTDPNQIMAACDNVPYMQKIRLLAPEEYLAIRYNLTRGCVHNGADAYSIEEDGKKYCIFLNTKGALVIPPKSAAGIAGCTHSHNPEAPSYQFVFNPASNVGVTKVSLSDAKRMIDQGNCELVTMDHHVAQCKFIGVPHGFGRNHSISDHLANGQVTTHTIIRVGVDGVMQSINPGTKGDTNSYKNHPTKHFFDSFPELLTSSLWSLCNHKEGVVREGQRDYVEMVGQMVNLFKPLFPNLIKSINSGTPLLPLEKLITSLFIGLDLILLLGYKNIMDNIPFVTAICLKALIKRKLYPNSIENGLTKILDAHPSALSDTA